MPEVGVRARQERRHLGHEFLADVLRGAEPVLVEAGVEPALVAGGVRQLVQRGLVEPYDVVELLASRQQDLVVPGAVARVVAPRDVDLRGRSREVGLADGDASIAPRRVGVVVLDRGDVLALCGVPDRPERRVRVLPNPPPLEPSALESPVIASSSASAPSAGRDPLTVRMMQIQWPCSPRRTWPPAALICWNPAHRWSS